MKQGVKRYLLAIAMLLLQQQLPAQARAVLDVNSNWLFKLQYMVSRDSGVRVTLPHTWNAGDGSIGKADYHRGAGTYTRQLYIDNVYKEKRLFLKFQGAGAVTDLFVNGQHAGQHAGSFTAFCFEITPFLKPGQYNTFQIKVNNAYRLDVLPLEGDFVVFGGITRPLELLVLNKDCISPLNFGADGIHISQQTTAEMAGLQVRTQLLRATPALGLHITTIIKDREGKQVFFADSVVNSRQSSALQSCTIRRPHLWKGIADPYLYTVTVLLKRNQQVIDSVSQKMGLRYYRVDAQKGFFLNDQHYDLHGVCVHESSLKNGNALTPEMQIRDLQMIRDLGATAIRFTHYPHSQRAYDFCDSVGIIAWSEIPFVGPGGSIGSGFYNTNALKANARQQLVEMIRQNQHHASVLFWGLYNELENNSEGLVPFLKELHTLAHEEDPGRLTTVASNQDYRDPMNAVSDATAWNKYYGWYGHQADSVGTWFDMVHSQKPAIAMGLSEYGAGASLIQHDEILRQPAPKGKWHPEEWQTFFHERYWRQLSQRPYLWGKFIWVMFDFYSAYRTEGDADGVNNKGLVSMDRKTPKDAFYFYQANWTTRPMIHLAGQRLVYRTLPAMDIKAYTTVPGAQLSVNGKQYGTTTKEYGTCIWKNIPLQPGANSVRVQVVYNGITYQDTCTWIYQQSL